MTSESSDDGKSGIVQRKINIKVAISNNTEKDVNSISSQSSPTKINNETA